MYAQDSVKPRHRPLKKTKIAERAEYTTESEIGENEDDQARHNLISLSSAPKSEPDVLVLEYNNNNVTIIIISLFV